MNNQHVSPYRRVVIVITFVATLAFFTQQFQQAVAVTYQNATTIPAKAMPLETADVIETLSPSFISADKQATQDMEWGDMDGDGDLDLAIANYGQPNQLYINDGTGNFTVQEIDGEIKQTNALAWGDMDGDGDLDLAAANYNQINQIYENQGNGIFISADLGTGAGLTHDLAWGDMNGDGHLDLIVAGLGGTDLFTNDGQGNFTGTNIIPFSFSYGVSLGDADNDGALDIALANPDQTPSRILFNNGHGEFPDYTYIGASYAQTVDWGDMDNDGDLDLAVGTSFNGSGTYIYENDGNRQFSANTLTSARGETTSIKWGDIDNDSDLDLILGNENGRNEIHLNNGNGQFPIVYDLDTNQAATYAVTWADIDADGDLDLAIGNEDQQNSIYKNTTPPFLTPADLYPAEKLGSDEAAWGDADGDGDLDLAIANSWYNHLYINDGQGNFISQTLGTEITKTLSIAWGDMDGDNDLDLVVGNDTSQNKLLENDGNGNFSERNLDNTTFGTSAVAWGDADGDGDLDIAVSNWETYNQVYQNDGNGNFTPFNLEPHISQSTDIAWGDVDSDGDLDIVVGNVADVNRVYENDGAGNFTPYELTTQSVSSSWSIALGDADGDGDLDIAVGNGSVLAAQLNKLYINDGQGNFTDRFLGAGSHSTFEIAWGDMDNDGDLDLAVANNAFYVDANQLYENDGTGNFTTHTLGPDAKASTGLAWGDMDNDGDLDLAVTNGIYYDVACFCYKGRENQLLENTRQGSNLLPNNLPIITAARPTPNTAGFYAQANTLSETIIPITYTLSDPEAEPVGQVTAEYSLNGGGQWFPAIAASNTPTTNLATSSWPTGTQHTFFWDTFASGFFGRSDNVTMRFTAHPQPLASASVPTQTLQYPLHVVGPIQRPYATTTTYPFRVQGTQIQITQNGQPAEGAVVYYRPEETTDSPAYILGDANGIPLTTDSAGFLSGRPAIKPGDQLLAMWPVPTETLKISDVIPFADNYTLFHTSGPPTETGLNFNEVTSPGVVPIEISADYPLLVFHLNVSLEWDARNDQIFLLELEQSFKEASELLYDVTDGQVVLGQVNLFHDKAYWGRADIVIHADNSLRPSAVIGGVANQIVGDLDGPEDNPYPERYGPGQIHMGTSWDPYGENVADLGEEWTRALAHELAHYFFFLPDNYLGFKGENDNVLGRVVCPNSFMTSTIDPSYTELLIPEEWLASPACLNTLAQRTTGRADWQTVSLFYPMLNQPQSLSDTLNGPNQLPLAIIRLIPWAFETDTLPLTTRNFDIRTTDDERFRLSDAQAYLFKTYNPDDPTDDILIPLGNPTGGGDRLKVRGAENGDRLCLFDSSAQGTYYTCESISENQIDLTPQPLAQAWEPAVSVQAVTSSTFAISVTLEQPLTVSQTLSVQLFPQHYRTAPCISPLAQMTAVNNTLYTQTLTLPLPAFEFYANVFVTDTTSNPSVIQQQFVSFFRLNWPSDPPAGSLPSLPAECTAASEDTLTFAPIEGGDIQGLIYASNVPVAGPNNVGIGGPNNVGIGGPNNVGIGGPNNVGIGGPNNVGIGGPNNVGIGGPNNVGIGGASFQAPILSADAQVVIYNTESFFAPNGVATLQELPSPPAQTTHPWLVPVGQAYHVELETNEPGRYISFNYLQRDVPEGYEYTLTVYFLPDCPLTEQTCIPQWQRLAETQRFVENLIVAPLQTADGIYAIMATLEGNHLNPGWNLLSYPMPDTRCVGECTPEETAAGCLGQALASIAGQFNGLAPANLGGIPFPAPNQPTISTTHLEPNFIYWIHITNSDGATPYFAPPERSPDGTFPDCQGSPTVSVESMVYLPMITR